MAAVTLCSLLLFTGCETPAKSDKVYYISSQVIEFHRELLKLSSESVMAISSDGLSAGGGYCENPSGGHCGPNRLKEIALSKCRGLGGHDCFVFSIGSNILVNYVVVETPKLPSVTLAIPPAPAKEAPPKDAGTLALEGALVDWIKTHQSEFRRMLNSRLERSGPMPEAGLAIYSVGSVQASHRHDQEYEITVSYVLTTGGLSRSSALFNREYVQYDERHSIEVQFDGSSLRFP